MLVGEPAEERRQDHVTDQKGCCQRPRLGHRIRIIRRKKRVANLRFNRCKDVPIEVTKNVQR